MADAATKEAPAKDKTAATKEAPAGASSSGEKSPDASETRTKVGSHVIAENRDKTKTAPPPVVAEGPQSRAERARKQAEADAALGTVKVRAVVDGFYIGRRKAGTEFDFPIARLQEKDGVRILPRWMELAEK